MGNDLCPLCPGKLSLSRPGFAECASCGLAVKAEKMFVAPVYRPELESEIYCAAKADLFAGAMGFIETQLPRKGRLLDIGCAGGELLKIAAARGWEAEGVELEPGLAAKASGNGFKVYSKPVENAGLEHDLYDAVTIFEVFSQMSAPAAAAAEIFSVLKPGGLIYVREFNAAFHLAAAAPCLRGFFGLFGMKPSVLHNFNFRAKTLRVLLERAGFRDVKISNSRPTSGDPYRSGGRLGGFLTGLAKFLYYCLAQVLWLITFGRVYAGSALIVTAHNWPSDGQRSWPSDGHSP